MADEESLRSLTSSQWDSLEADWYWCLTKFIDYIQDHYTFAQPGIQRSLYIMKELVRRVDPLLHDWLEAEKVQYIEFAFRWVNCLLMRELPLPAVFRTWDTYLSEEGGFAQLHVYVCTAFLTTWSTQLRGLEFQELLARLQHPPTEEWTEEDIEPVLSQAYVWMTMYQDTLTRISR